MPTVRKDLINGQKVKITKSNHADVPAGTIAIFREYKDDGIAVAVTRMFRPANSLQSKESTEIVWVDGDGFEVI